MLKHVYLTALLPLLLCACAGTPNYDKHGADGALTPQNVAARPQQAVGKQVLWGGVIMKTVNLQDRTQIEVLGYPLGSNEKPNIDAVATGRFVIGGPMGDAGLTVPCRSRSSGLRCRSLR